ncbi:hypothetical protein O4H49_03460 [Kiloniella laminariae]|uniref:SH3b domain-containing protein n=1 Tax=Kiloniella laminariae TaxID=454162 RepID=A0ABT4LFE0_9PROT|nr:hypothetical protein [Kiloniella laminariae]MCZ4279820.1 hypothetical protein [Kiloniella laminariae]
MSEPVSVPNRARFRAPISFAAARCRDHLAGLGGLLALVLFSQSVLAEMPEQGQTLPLPGGTGTYRIEGSQGQWQLLMTPLAPSPASTPENNPENNADNNPDSSISRVDLSGCHFCQITSEDPDDEDNCSADGIFPLRLGQESYVGVACHVGAHSQRVSIYAPGSTVPLFEVTGDYFTEMTLYPGALSVAYDRMITESEMSLEQAVFPPEKQQEILLISQADYQLGSIEDSDVPAGSDGSAPSPEAETASSDVTEITPKAEDEAEAETTTETDTPAKASKGLYLLPGRQALRVGPASTAPVLIWLNGDEQAAPLQRAGAEIFGNWYPVYTPDGDYGYLNIAQLDLR